ncbi:hypothetical protein [Pseudorhodobacter sp.]|uniref:hypothetical protein n=1 Tax=Pseudorhodobacter sp. TaxID=1934400 RepID=UPI002649B2D4|nr:hypothetical protein [Pseudorhodobacter sp.]MDN5786634.1 hypothetical protein [Pseudorhodobacter sp.]
MLISLNRRRNLGWFASKTLRLGMIGGVAAVLTFTLVVYVKTVAPLRRKLR